MERSMQWLAYLLVLAACLTGSLFYTHLFLALAALAGIIFLIFTDNLFGVDFYWLLAVLIINLVQFAIFFTKRGSDFKTLEEERLYRTLFSNFTIPQFKKIINAAKVENAEPGELLTEEGKPVSHLILIFKGKARVVVGGHTIAYCHSGNLIGEISFLTGSLATATVYVVEPMNYIKWSQDSLRNLLESDEDLNQAMQRIFNTDFLRKYQLKENAENKI